MNKYIGISVAIDLLKLDKLLDLTCYPLYLKSVKFSYDNGEGYIWCAESSRSFWTYYPMKNSQYVKYFKTLKGAKRNFLRTHCKEDKIR